MRAQEPRKPPSEADTANLGQIFNADSAADAHWSVAAFDGAVRRASRLAPDYPRVVLHTARLAARAGRPRDALSALARVAPLGLGYDIGQDRAFASLLDTPEFERLRRLASENATPRLLSDTAFTVTLPDLIPENIAYDARTDRFFIGSLAQGTVHTVDRSGSARPFSSGNLGQVVGMKVDTARDLLWANVKDASAGPGKGAALLALDLASGALRRRYTPPDTTGPHFLNDLVVAPDGTLYVTDSEGGHVYVLRPNAEALAPLPIPGFERLRYANGIALLPGGRTLAVAHAFGLLTMDLASSKVSVLRTPDAVSIDGIDGLYALMGADGAPMLVGIQSGIGFDQVIGIVLDPSATHVRDMRVLDRARPDYELPTTGVMVRDTLFYIANSQLRRMDDAGRLTRPVAPRTIILRLPASSGAARR
jgi:sugar lactone lactonase YvrE